MYKFKYDAEYKGVKFIHHKDGTQTTILHIGDRTLVKVKLSEKARKDIMNKALEYCKGIRKRWKI